MLRIVCPNPALDRTVVVDELREGVPNRPLEVHEFPGGKGFNVAYAVSLREAPAGRPVDFAVYAMLGGKIGEKVEELAGERAIPVVTLDTGNDTRTCNIVVERQTQRTYPIYEGGLSFANADRERLARAVTSQIGADDWVIVSGSMPPGLREEFVPQVVEACRAATAQIVVDTSGPSLVGAEQAGPTVLKVNNDELSEAFGGVACDTAQQIGALLRERVNPAIPLVIITRGSRGAVARLGASVLELHGRRLDARNPVASGDVFLGSLVSRLAQDGVRLDALARRSGDGDPISYIAGVVAEAMSWSASNCLHDVPYVDLDEAADYAGSVEWRRV